MKPVGESMPLVNVRVHTNPADAVVPLVQHLAQSTEKQLILPVRTAVTQVHRIGVRYMRHAMVTVAETELFHLVIQDAAARDVLLPVEVQEAAPDHRQIPGESGESSLETIFAILL